VAVPGAKTTCANIANTPFPVPKGEVIDTLSGPALVRRTELIGQLADTSYLVKLAALFRKLAETAATKAPGYNHPDDLRVSYPKNIWN
jgi:hypothetical protein